MQTVTTTTRRKRRRRPTMTPRFGSSQVALEIGLIRLSLGVLNDVVRKEEEDEKKGD